MPDIDQINTLVKRALEARQGSYAPYSEFLVGAALLTQSGAIYQGSNVENASYGAGICAERTAAVKAVSAGDRIFTAIAVAGFRADAAPDDRTLAYPCGICRQFLNEFSMQDMPVYIVRSETDYVETTLGALLPHAFGPEDLESSGL